MQFVLATTVSYWWPVVVNIPDPNNPGAIIEQKLKVLFEPDDQDQAIQHSEAFSKLRTITERAEHDRRHFERVVKDWDDIVDKDKRPVPFTPENFRAALQQSWFRDAVHRAYSESLNGEARLGN